MRPGLGGVRVMVGNTAMLQHLHPAFGTYFLAEPGDAVYQWDGVIWQRPAESGGLTRADLLKLAAKQAARGGSGSVPGIRRPGIDPSIDDPALFTAPPTPGAPVFGGMDVPILTGGGGDSRSQSIAYNNGAGVGIIEFEDFKRTTVINTLGTASCGLLWTTVVAIPAPGDFGVLDVDPSVDADGFMYYDGDGIGYRNVRTKIGPSSAWAGPFVMTVRANVDHVGGEPGFTGPQYAYWLGNAADTVQFGVGFFVHNVAGNIFIFDDSGTLIVLAKVDWLASTWYILEWWYDGFNSHLRVYKEGETPQPWQAAISFATPLLLGRILRQSLNIDALASQYIDYVIFRNA